MFQLKNMGSGIKEPAPSNALPNSYGKVRTFKEDLENFGKQGTAEGPSEEELPPFQETGKNPTSEPLKKEENPQSMPAAPMAENIPANPFQSVPTPPPVSSPGPGVGMPVFKSSPSQNFFAEKPSPQENILPQKAGNQPLPQKPKSRLVLPLIIILLVTVAGAGFFYYWFYVRNSSPAANSTDKTASGPSQSASSETKNKNLRRLVVDTSQSPTEIKNAVQKFATDFSSPPSGSSLVEVKLLDKNNQLIGKKDFFSSFGAAIPEAILMKLSEDYSVFVTGENGDTRLGLAFKTVTSSGLADEMKNWEPKITTDLGSLYLAPNSAPAPISFGVNRYKNADIRYFNFSSPTNTSLDYSIISNFLVISTSKNSLRSILDYMSER